MMMMVREQEAARAANEKKTRTMIENTQAKTKPKKNFV